MLVFKVYQAPATCMQCGEVSGIAADIEHVKGVSEAANHRKCDPHSTWSRVTALVCVMHAAVCGS
jgi:hypothetical protein